MRYEDFWELCPRTLAPVLKAMWENTNTEAWLQGIYFGMAIGASFGLSTHYPDNPLQPKKQESVANRMRAIMTAQKGGDRSGGR